MIELITKRYFRNGAIKHHADCCIYQSRIVYGWAACNCGLLHDLLPMNFHDALEIYPDYEKDLHYQETGEKI